MWHNWKVNDKISVFFMFFCQSFKTSSKSLSFIRIPFSSQTCHQTKTLRKIRTHFQFDCSHSSCIVGKLYDMLVQLMHMLAQLNGSKALDVGHVLVLRTRQQWQRTSKSVIKGNYWPIKTINKTIYFNEYDWWLSNPKKIRWEKKIRIFFSSSRRY